MVGAPGLLLLRAALCVAVSRGDTIKIILDRLIDPLNGDSKSYLIPYIEVSDQITAADLVEKVNFYGKVYADDWDWHRKFSRGGDAWSDDGGNLLNDQYSKTVQGPFQDLFVNAFYGGMMMRPTSTLRSNGVKEMSTVLFSRVKDDATSLRLGTDMVYTRVTHNGKNDYLYFYRREDMWNLFNLLTHRYGIQIDDSKFTLPVKGTVMPKTAAPHDVGFMTLGKIKDDSGSNPIYVTAERLKVCTCMDSSKFASEKSKMSKRLGNANYGQGCSDHDMEQKWCSSKNIVKGNRQCWCKRKWCYVEDGCGSPSSKFPGLSFSYDICQNVDNVDCFASDTEGVEAAKLDDFDIWTFPKVTGYLRQMVTVLADAFPSLKTKFELD